MNRRSFLSFLSVAPVAVPMAIAAANAPVFIGIDWASETDRLSVAYMCRTLDGARECWNRSPPYQRAHDALMFQLDSVLRDTPEPQAPVSPDTENGIPTAASLDDRQQSLHLTDIRGTNASESLGRAWGVNEGRVGA